MPDAPKLPAKTFWCRRRIRITVRGPDGVPLVIHVDKPFARIGSHADADVVLPDRNLPPLSLYLHATDEGIYCLGLDPSGESGLLTNVWLRPNSRARVGPYRISAAFDDEGPLPAGELSDPRARDSITGPAPHLRIASRDQEQAALDRTWRRQLTLVGRQAPSKLRLIHPTVSKVHCVLYWDGQSLWAVDLLSANGTRLAGQRIECLRLKAGQTLEFGQLLLTYLGVVEELPSDEEHPAASDAEPPPMPLHTQRAADPAGLPADEERLFEPPRAERTAPEGELAQSHRMHLRIAELEAAQQRAEQRLGSLQSLFDEQSHCLAQQREQAAAREATERVRGEELAERIAQLERERDELGSELAAAGRREQEQNARAAEWEAAQETAEDERRQLQAAFDEQAFQLAQAQARAAETETQDRIAQHELAGQLDRLQAELTKAAERETEHLALRDELDRARQAAEEQRHHLQADLDEQTAQLAIEREQVAADRVALNEAMAALQQAHEQQAQFEAQEAAAEQELARLRAELDEARFEIQRLQQSGRLERAALEQEIRRLHDQGQRRQLELADTRLFDAQLQRRRDELTETRPLTADSAPPGPQRGGRPVPPEEEPQ